MITILGVIKRQDIDDFFTCGMFSCWYRVLKEAPRYLQYSVSPEADLVSFCLLFSRSMVSLIVDDHYSTEDDNSSMSAASLHIYSVEAPDGNVGTLMVILP
jgi:hypothetical protein